MVKLNKLRIDPGKEVDGVWFDHPSGIRVRVARMGNPNYQKALTRIAMRSRGKTHGRDDPGVKRAVAEHILKDWELVEDDEGKAKSYTADVGYEVFMDPEFNSLYGDVLGYAAMDEAYLRETVEEQSGNLNGASDG